MLLLTLLVVLFAQTLSSLIWVSQLRATQLEGLVTSARSLAHSMTASVSYLRSLPVAYRPLVLDQLRSMGGTRFVVTLNDKPLGMDVLPITPRKLAVLKAVDDVLRRSLGSNADISVNFVSPDDLRIFNAGLKLDELPRSWAHYALTLEPVNPPVLVTQIQMAPGNGCTSPRCCPNPTPALKSRTCPSNRSVSSCSPAACCCCSSVCWCTGRADRSSVWPGPRGTCPWAPRWNRWPRAAAAKWWRWGGRSMPCANASAVT